MVEQLEPGALDPSSHVEQVLVPRSDKITLAALSDGSA